MITLGTDAWSLELRAKLRASEHYQTLSWWAAGKDPAELDTPYYDRLVTLKRAPPEKAARMQAAFHKMYVDAPNWPKLAPVKLNGVWQGPIMVRIQADGSFRSEDGWHRKAILEFLNEPIEAVVIDRAREWVSLRERLAACMGGRGWKGKLYQRIPHPDFADWPVHHDPPVGLAHHARLHGVRSVLDLGAHFGAVLTLLNPAVGVGVERDALTYEVANLVLPKHGMTAVNADVLDHLRADDTRYDLILALAILHHIPEYDELLGLIRARARYVAVTVPTPAEAGSSRLPAGALDYVRGRLGARLIGTSEYASRPLHFLEVT